MTNKMNVSDVLFVANKCVVSIMCGGFMSVREGVGKD